MSVFGCEQITHNYAVLLTPCFPPDPFSHLAGLGASRRCDLSVTAAITMTAKLDSTISKAVTMTRKPAGSLMRMMWIISAQPEHSFLTMLLRIVRMIL